MCPKGKHIKPPDVWLFSFIDLSDVLTKIKGKHIMAKIIRKGIQTRQSVRFGLKHKYIAKKLTNRNYRWYAAVRGGLYFYVTKNMVSENEKSWPEYIVTKWDEKGKSHIEMETKLKFFSLNEALKMINNFNNGIEGNYPKEMRFGWVSLDSSIYKDGWKIIIPGWKAKQKSKDDKFNKLAEFLSRAPISFKDD